MTDSTDRFDARALLTHRDFLRRYVRSLIRDENDAADLVQETWVETLQSRPHDGVGMRSWLRKVARRKATRTRLRSARRAEHEQAVGPDQNGHGPDELALQMELQERVVRLLRSLREPYRSTLFLRFFHDLPPREIARREDVPVETVKTRLSRGLAILRRQLDEHSGERARWMRALAPLAGFRPEPVVGAALGTSVLPTIFGGLVMSWKALVPLALALGVGAVWFRSNLTSPDPSVHSSGASTADSSAGVAEGGTDTARAVAMPSGASDRTGEATVPTRTNLSASAPSTERTRVRVVNASGTPVAGIEVALLRRNGRHETDRLLTDANGEVVPELRFGARIARLGFVHEPPVEVELPDPEIHPPADAAELLILTMPPTGWLELCVPALEGHETRRQGLVRRRGSSEPARATPRSIENGVARFRVGLDLQLEAGLESTPNFPNDWIAAQGPTVEGATTRVELGGAMVVGRLLTPDGVPITDHSAQIVHSYLRSERQRTFGMPSATDAEGEFLWYVPPSRAKQANLVITVEGRAASHAESSDSSVPRSLIPSDLPAAHVPLPGLRDGELRQLGDVVLGTGNVLVSGHVVDDLGAPAVGCEIHLQRLYHSEWFGFGEPRAIADDRGHFVILGPPPPERVAVLAQGQSYAPVSRVEFAPGARNIDVLVCRKGTVAPKFAKQFVEQHPRAEVRLTPQAQTLAQPVSVLDLRFRPRFSVAPGRYDLTVTANSATLVSICDLEVRSGEECRDPRLQLVDIAVAVRTVELRVTDADGLSLPRRATRVWAAPAGAGRGVSVGPEPDGVTYRMSLTAAGLDVKVEAQGYRTVRLADVQADTEVRLRPAFPIRIELVGSSPTLQDEEVLCLSLRSRDPRLGEKPVPIESDGAQWLASMAGEHEVRWSIVDSRSEAGTTYFGLDVERATVTILETDHEQLVEIAYPRELESALATVRTGR